MLKNDYLFIAVGQVGGANEDVRQQVLNVPDGEKMSKLKSVLGEEVEPNSKVLIFVEMKKKADFLAARLCQDKLKCTSIHGDREQREREIALGDFKSGSANILVATSVAARGLDIPKVAYVINFDMPSDIDEYVHRIGRTGRVGQHGNAITFIDTAKDNQILRSLVSVLTNAKQSIPPWLDQHATGAQGTFSDFSQSAGRTDIREFVGNRNPPSRGGGGGDQFSFGTNNNADDAFASLW